MEELRNFKKERLTIDLKWANIFGILLLIPIVLVFGLPYYMLWKDNIDIKNIIHNIEPALFTAYKYKGTSINSFLSRNK